MLRYREELRMRDQVIGMAGSLPGRVSEQAWARLNLAKRSSRVRRLTRPYVARGMGGRVRPSRQGHRPEQRKTLGRCRFGAGYLELYDRLVRRLAPP